MMMKTNIIPKYIFFINHGKTEVEFANNVIKRYWNLLLETNENLRDSLWGQPSLNHLNKGEEDVCVDTLENKIHELITYENINKLTSNKFGIDLESNSNGKISFVFIILIDFNEGKRDKDDKQKHLIKNVNSFIEKALSKIETCHNVELLLYSAKIIYFDGSIEKTIPNYIEESREIEEAEKEKANQMNTVFKSYSKQKKMKEWALFKFKSVNEISEIRNKFKTKKDSNVVELFDFLDELKIEIEIILEE